MAKKNNIVGKTKGKTIGVMIIIIAVCWLIVLGGMMSNNEALKQEQMIESAQKLIEDKLYVRAAKIYVNALNEYNTKNNTEIEKKLGELYKEGEMFDEYYTLVKKRIENGRATEEEYMDLINSYMEVQSYNSALEYLMSGTKAYPDNQEMRDLYESLKYTCKRVTLNYTDVKIPSTDWYLPVYNGEYWGYIKEDGRTEIDFKYDEATAFYGKYAVVKLDGVYTLIDKSGYWNAVDKNGIEQVTQLCGSTIIGVNNGEYSFYSNTFKLLSEDKYDKIIAGSSDRFFVQRNGKWALLDQSFKSLTEYIFTDVCTNDYGEVFFKDYGMVADENGYYMINRNGEARFAARFADARGIESGYVAVAGQNGKWGFINEKGEYIIEPAYDEAKSFSSGLAAVKIGDKWGYVNKYGQLQIENEYSEAFSFIKDKALVIDQLGECRILVLKYYSIYN